ncbi:Qc-SNARE protein [Perkinsela sp. CCAP 1560/4]|nr:Qc-SNARE protein [Perkinsela sp. CCAP 1560/4]KNH06713.1 Qc-SNARE protein [Perkinsela sp. CCAP 1560/4]|eukprot:KNH04708.1 Qc-SNARE protein [Perkinsela sp. CCAP 1560/4]
MTIQYACIYDAQSLVAEWPVDHQSTTVDALKQVVTTIPKHVYRRKSLDDTKGSGMNFHYISTGGGQVFICAASPEMRAQIVFQFLDVIEQSFQNTDSKKLNKLIAEKADFFNRMKNDKLAVLHREIDNVKDIMLQNMDSVISRGEHLDSMAQKSTQLVDDATSFQRTAVRIKRMEYARKIKLVMIFILAFGAFITVILMIACKPNFSKCR